MSKRLTASDRFVALRIVAIYAFASALWIFLSDRLLEQRLEKVRDYVWYSTAKGMLFIAVTVTLLYILIARHLLKRRENEEAIRRVNEELEQRVEERTKEHVQGMEELHKAQLMLIHQNRLAAMGDLLNNIAHHWRQPLNSLGLLLQETAFVCRRDEGCRRDLVQENVAKAMVMLREISKTIDNFRELSTPDKESSTFDVATIIEKSVTLVLDGFRDRGITVDVDTGGGMEVTGYPNEYSQVLVNILMNAKDAFDEGKVQDARVLIRAWQENGRSVVTITDNAGGIPSEVLPDIFDAFYTSKGVGRRTGLGLFMAKNIIERDMKGRLTARNIDGGAEFRIEV